MDRKAASVIMLTLLLTSTLALVSKIQSVSSTSEPPFSDDFNNPTLDSRWTIIDPNGGSSFDLVSNPGWLRIKTVNTNAPCILQNVSEGFSDDFTIETKVMATMNESGEGAGIIVRKYDPHYDYSLVLLRLYRQSEHQIGFGIPSNGLNYVTLASDLNPTYLKLERKPGPLFKLYYSSNGTTWNTLAWIGTLAGVGLQIGLKVTNSYNGSFSADFDYFKFSNPIIVPNDYPTIQEAINHANEGDTIYVKTGTYYEHVVVNKTVSLIGEKRSTTIIDGNGTGAVIYVTNQGAKVTVEEFTIRNGESGLEVYAPFNTIRNNIFTMNHHGMRVGYYNISADYTVIRDNLVTKNEYFGIEIGDVHSVTLKNNTLSENKYNLMVSGHSVGEFVHDIDTSNRADNKPIYYLINQRDVIISPSAFPDVGYLALINSTNVTIKDLNITNSQGLLLAFTQGSKVENVSVSNNYNGISMIYSSGNTLSNIVATDNYQGIYLYESDNNIVFNFTIPYGLPKGWESYGIHLMGSKGNVISNNDIANTRHGIASEWASNNTFLNNRITSVPLGFFFYSSFYNNIKGNTILNSSVMLWASNSSDIYHNNFIETRISNIENSTNIWDNGCEGNYWSDYNGTDFDNDGVGDTYLPWLGVDNYPLMRPYTVSDINHDAIVDVFDLIKVGVAFGSKPGEANWNPHADLNNDNLIDVFDLIRVAIHFGEKYP